MDRARLESDLRAIVDLLLTVAPPQLVNLDLAAMMGRLGPLGPTLFRTLGLPTSGTWDLRATLYAACSRIAALPDDQLRSVIGIVEGECVALIVAPEVTPPDRRTLTAAEWDAIAAVLDELRKAVAL